MPPAGKSRGSPTALPSSANSDPKLSGPALDARQRADIAEGDHAQIAQFAVDRH
jgi:hypothetical protein